MSEDSMIGGFLSHRAKDKLKDEALKGLLTTWGRGKLGLFLSSTDLKGANKWRDTIFEYLPKQTF